MRDADMIAVVGVLMRLNGADAPGLETCAGQDAKRWMVGDDWWTSVPKRRAFVQHQRIYRQLCSRPPNMMCLAEIFRWCVGDRFQMHNV